VDAERKSTIRIKHAFIATATFVWTIVAPTWAQTAGDRETAQRQITVIGCIERESDYRRAHDAGRGGPFGLGLGRGDEYVLVNAIEIMADRDIPAEAHRDCGTAVTGKAFELEGGLESELEGFAGHRIQVMGTVDCRAQPVLYRSQDSSAYSRSPALSACVRFVVDEPRSTAADGDHSVLQFVARPCVARATSCRNRSTCVSPEERTTECRLTAHT
jgi:hypothetical protein